MNYNDQIAELEKAKAEASQQYNNLTQAQCGGSLGYGATVQSPKQEGLRDRVAINLHHAQQEARRTEALYELQHLLEKNPDVARILDLLEVAGVR